MSKTITIGSTITITVTAGLEYEDHTNTESDIPNRMKVKPTWPVNNVQIKKGQGQYPAYIKDWPTVKALEKDGVLTLGKVEGEDEETQNIVEEVEEQPKRRRKEQAPLSLNEIAGQNDETEE